MLIVDTATWPDVGLALIAALPGILTLVLQLVLRSNLRTPSGKSLGAVAEYAHDTAIANNMRLTAIGDKVGAVTDPRAGEIERKINGDVDQPAPDQT